MKIKSIYIPDELFDLLKQEDNASSLITRLLNDYFNSIKEKEQIKEEEVIDPITTMNKAVEKERIQRETDELNAILSREEALMDKAIEQLP